MWIIHHFLYIINIRNTYYSTTINVDVENEHFFFHIVVGIVDGIVFHFNVAFRRCKTKNLHVYV